MTTYMENGLFILDLLVAEKINVQIISMYQNLSILKNNLDYIPNSL